MYSYCTVRDVRAALTPNGEEAEADRPETGANLPDWQIEDAIEEAEGVVNTFIATRYSVPVVYIDVINPDDADETWVFQVALSPVRGLTRDVAAFLVALTFRKNKDLGEDDPIRLRYDMAMMMLTAIRDSKSSLPFPPAGGDNATNGVLVVNLYEGTLFGLEDFQLGPSTLEANVLWPLRGIGSRP